jgi:hypothetical protein
MALLGAPVAMWVVCLGCGLAFERVLKLRLSNALLLPLGLCVALALIYPGYAAGAGDALAIALLVVVTLAGLVFAKDGLRARLNPGWPGVAGAAAYVLYMLPVIAYGHWTWVGYDFVNDSAFEMLLASHIKGYGLTLGAIPLTSEQQFLMSYLNTGYPLGTQSLLGTISGLTGTEVAVLYQGFIASLAALGALALATVTRGLLDARKAALAGFAAIAANLTYQYALQGNIKEIGLLAILCAGVALGREAIERGQAYAGAALMAVVAAAALATYNAVAAPFLGALALFLGLGLLLLRRSRPSREWIGPLLVGLGLAGLLAIPSLVSFKTFFNVASTGQGSTGIGAIQLGQLLRPLPLSQLSGVWLSGEYRSAIASHHAGLLTAIATVAILLAIVPCVVWALRRRAVAVPAAIGMVGLVLLIVFPRVSPYAQGKLLAMCSPFVVLAGVAGLLCLGARPSTPHYGGQARSGGDPEGHTPKGTPPHGGGQAPHGGGQAPHGGGQASHGGGQAPHGGGQAGGRRLGALGLIATMGVGFAILASDLLAYNHDRVAPTGRIEAIRRTGDHFAGRGLVLWNEFEEYAKYFARAAKISVPFEALTPQQVELRSPTYFYGHYFDLDEELLSFVERYPIIVTRRSPVASRPPANYKLVYENGYYLGWERTAKPEVLGHLPLQQLYSPTFPVNCAMLAPIVAKAPRGSHLILAEPPQLVSYEPLPNPKRPAGWPPDPGQAGSVFTAGPGRIEGELTVKRPGFYRVWVQGDFPRALHVRVDGREVGSVSGSNTPGQWLQAATLRLSAGPHLVAVEKAPGRDHLGPGEWAVGTFGAVALQSEAPERMVALSLAHWHTLCGKEADWVEVVRG